MAIAALAGLARRRGMTSTLRSGSVAKVKVEEQAEQSQKCSTTLRLFPSALDGGCWDAALNRISKTVPWPK
jgi:hypothetical protein